ncbi:TMhelix containing protein [Vibrio phage 1.081.O._10N.286.52.C2]|nr:TMhelix containing protein [Vibrio phage 1.081.O._10N.286.52.C2]
MNSRKFLGGMMIIAGAAMFSVSIINIIDINTRPDVSSVSNLPETASLVYVPMKSPPVELEFTGFKVGQVWYARSVDEWGDVSSSSVQITRLNDDLTRVKYKHIIINDKNITTGAEWDMSTRQFKNGYILVAEPLTSENSILTHDRVLDLKERRGNK